MSVVIVVVISIFWVLLLISSVYQTLKSSVTVQLNNSIDQVSSIITQDLSNLENCSLAFLATPTMRSWRLHSTSFQDYVSVSNLQSEINANLMFNTAWLSKCIDAVYLAEGDTLFQLVTRLPSSRSQLDNCFFRVYEQTIQEEDSLFYYVDRSADTPAVYMLRRVHDISNSKQLTLIFQINSTQLCEKLAAHSTDFSAFVLYNGTILFASDINTIGTALDSDMLSQSALTSWTPLLLNHRSELSVVRTLDAPGYSVVASIPFQSVLSPVFTTIANYLLILAFLVPLFGIFGGLVAKKYTHFISLLYNGIVEVKKNNFNVMLPSYKNEELNEISHVFNEMTSEIKRLVNQVYRSELLLKDADIRLLQSQINPHFLINTLATISTQALLNSDQEVYEMTTALCTMLDSSMYNTSDDSPFITLSREMEYVENYLYIQKIRFGDRLDFTISITEPELTQLYIPRLCIEPIVENAVIHGVSDMENVGVVKITVRCEADNLLILVSDNGKGFNVEQVMSRHTGPDGRGHHVGLINTDKRLKLLLGEQYGITFKSEPYVQTTAYIRVPIFHSKPNQEENGYV